MMLVLHHILLYILDPLVVERIWKLIMTIGDKTRNENILYDINWEAAKTLALSSGKTKKYEYLSGDVILTFE